MQFLLEFPPPVSFFIVSAITTFPSLVGLYLVRREVFGRSTKGEPRSRCDHFQRLRIVLWGAGSVCGVCYLERI